MAEWTIQRLEINRRIRSVLVSHFINLGKVSVNVYPRRVSLRGTLIKQGGAGTLTVEEVTSMFQEIERLPGVKRVQTTFMNWQKGAADLWVDTTATVVRDESAEATNDAESHLTGSEDMGQILEID